MSIEVTYWLRVFTALNCLRGHSPSESLDNQSQDILKNDKGSVRAYERSNAQIRTALRKI